MWPYLLFALIIILLYHYKQPEWMVVVMVLFAALRYATGWDFFNYYEMGESLVALKRREVEYGPLWRPLLNLAFNLHAPQLIIAIPAMIMYPVLFYGLSLITNKNSVADALFVYAFWPFFYLASFSTIRQAIAVCVGVLFVAYSLRRKTIPAIITMVFAFLLHPSAIILAPFPFVARFKRALNLPECLLLVVGGGVVLKLALKVVASAIGYGVYVGDTGEFGGMLFLVYVVVTAHLALAVARSRNPYSIRSKVLSMVLIFFALETFVYVSDLPSVIARAALYYEVLLIYVAHYSMAAYKQGKSMRMVLNILLVSFFLVYLFWIRNENGASAGFVPYQWIISIF